MMKILVTGGAGYLGSVLVPDLLRAGYNVTVLDRFPRGDASLAACCRYAGFTPVRGDARDERVVSGLIPLADVIIPLAAIVGAPACAADPLAATTTNRNAVLMIIRNIGRGQRLVYPNTNSGYGVGANRECDEDTPLRPISIYGTTKCDAETAVLGAGGVSLRLATVYGMSPRMRLDLMVNDFVHRAVTDRAITLFEAHHRRSVVHVQDVSRAFRFAISNTGYPEMSGRPFNVVGENVTKLELCARIAEQVHGFVYSQAAVGEDPDKRDYAVSAARIADAGFQPQWTLDHGIRELIKGYAMLNARRFVNA